MKKSFRILKFKKDKPIFEVRDVSKSFSGRSILKKISLKVYPGELVSLFGPMLIPRNPSWLLFDILFDTVSDP